jgi:hypothetical protein
MAFILWGGLLLQAWCKSKQIQVQNSILQKNKNLNARRM